jgi:hypothetical protein
VCVTSVSTVRLGLLLSMLVLAVPTYCCQCGGSFFPGKTPREIAEIHREGASLIFEGTPERLDLRWDLLDAKDGDLVPVPTNGPYPLDNSEPRTVVTFRVQRTYKGQLGTDIKVSTGLGGGDCAARFTPEFVYLVYLYPTNTGEFAVGMCSPGGWIEASELAPDLRYLRGEQPIPSDLVRYRPYGTMAAKQRAAAAKQRQIQYEEFQRKLATITGKICGTVVREGAKDADLEAVSFLSTQGYLPGERPFAAVKDDGSFCSEPLGPGKYYVCLRATREKVTLASYYPGVAEKKKATPIEVTAGQSRRDIVLKSIPQKTYSVRGFISTNERTELKPSVVLLRLGGDLRTDYYSQAIDFQSVLPLPKVKYFKFENVLPGRYVAFVEGMGPGWFTKKLELTVSTDNKFIFMELVHKKWPQPATNPNLSAEAPR